MCVSSAYVSRDIGIILCETSVSVERCVMADIRSFFKPTAANSECTRHPEEPDPKRPRLQSFLSGTTSSDASKHVGSANFSGFSWWRETEVCLEFCVHCVIDIIQRTRATGTQSGV